MRGRRFIYIFQYNKKIEGLKEDISSTNKEIASIKKEAFDEIEQEKIRTKEQLNHEREKLQNQIKEEIIDVAFEMSKAIVEREIDREKHQDIIDEALGKFENKQNFEFYLLAYGIVHI